MIQPAICSLLFASMYAAFYACGSRRHLWYYAALVALPVICLVRGPMLAAFACLPLSPAPLGKYRRWALCGMLIVAGILVLYTPRFQARMFQSGHGKVEELRWDDPNIKTSGRSVMWGVLWAGVEERPWFGHGLNESRTALLDRGFPTYLPHNDWLKLLYEVGSIGTACYLLTMVVQVLRLRSIGARGTGALRMLAYGASGAFIPFAITMFTDNTILYVQYFCNLHFCLIGFIYGNLRFLNTQKVLSRNEQFTRVQRHHPALQQRTNG
jgi:O-antigen ligase